MKIKVEIYIISNKPTEHAFERFENSLESQADVLCEFFASSLRVLCEFGVAILEESFVVRLFVNFRQVCLVESRESVGRHRVGHCLTLMKPLVHITTTTTTTTTTTNTASIAVTYRIQNGKVRILFKNNSLLHCLFNRVHRLLSTNGQR